MIEYVVIKESTGIVHKRYKIPNLKERNKPKSVSIKVLPQTPSSVSIFERDMDGKKDCSVMEVTVSRLSAYGLHYSSYDISIREYTTYVDIVVSNSLVRRPHDKR